MAAVKELRRGVVVAAASERDVIENDRLRVARASRVAEANRKLEREREQPSARLSLPQLFEIERMSAQGMRLDEIAQRLAIPLDVFEVCMQGSTQIRDAYLAGQARGKDIMSGTIFKAGQSGDVGAAKFWLERVGGEQWKPKPAGPAVVVHTGPMVQLDMVDIDRRLARQSALLDGRTIDVDAEPSE